MSTSDDYRAMAEECFRRAQEAQTNNERQGYLELARTWLAAASKVDCGPNSLLCRLAIGDSKHNSRRTILLLSFHFFAAACAARAAAPFPNMPIFFSAKPNDKTTPTPLSHQITFG